MIVKINNNYDRGLGHRGPLGYSGLLKPYFLHSLPRDDTYTRQLSVLSTEGICLATYG